MSETVPHVEIGLDEAGIDALLTALNTARQWHIITEGQYNRIRSMAHENLSQLVAGHTVLTFDDEGDYISLAVRSTEQ